MHKMNLITELKIIIVSKDVDLIDDTGLVIMYLKLGNVMFDYLKSNSNKDLILSSVFKNLKTELATIYIRNLKSIKSLYQLAVDYHKLNSAKTFLKQVSINNQILIMRNANSINQMISDIKNTVIESCYIDMYAKNHYYNQLLENEKDEEQSFMETISSLGNFKVNTSLKHNT